MLKKFETAIFKIPSELVDVFAEHFDGNSVHRGSNSNEVMPAGTVPGLMVISMASKAVLQVAAFKEILCARGFKGKFLKPVMRDQSCFVRGTYEDQPHQSREGVVFRKNECEIICQETGEVVIEYEVTQLLRTKLK